MFERPPTFARLLALLPLVAACLSGCSTLRQNAWYPPAAALPRTAYDLVDDTGNESIGVRSICYLPLTYDHRLIDGADAGRFVTTIKRRLEDGAFEADLGL